MTVCLVLFAKSTYQISGKLFAGIAAYIGVHNVTSHADSPAEHLVHFASLEAYACTQAITPSSLNEALEQLNVISLDSTCIKAHPDGMGALKKWSTSTDALVLGVSTSSTSLIAPATQR